MSWPGQPEKVLFMLFSCSGDRQRPLAQLQPLAVVIALTSSVGSLSWHMPDYLVQLLAG